MVDALTERGLVLDSIFFEVPHLRILQGAFLKVRPGRICALIGRNGCGKTTLLKVAAGQLKPSSGLVIIDGVRLYKKALRKRFAYLSYLPQVSMLPHDLSVRRILSAVPGAEALADDALIREVLLSRIGDLSGGERRYLEIQLLLHLERPYVLLDEPFTGIEPRLIERIADVIVERSRQGVSFLITDHYHHYLLPLADDAYLMVNRQCRPLNAEDGWYEQLEAYGYLHLG